MNVSEYLRLSIKDKFDYFMNTRFPTNRTPEYFVNWDKVSNNVENYKIGLNTLNYLVGSTNIKEDAARLFSQQPHLIKLIPLLIASRDKVITVLKIDQDMNYYNLDFEDIDISKIDAYINFMEESGLLNFLRDTVDSNLVDYVYGVEVGLDSNTRKNRSGSQNESILEVNLQRSIKDTNLEYKTQASADYIKNRWGITVPEPLDGGLTGGRRYDAAVFNPELNRVTIIETNYYGGGGSKLKAVAGEFSDMYLTSLRDAKNVDFIWISDGLGWDSAKNPLREAFAIIPNIINLNMVKKGFLRELLLN